MKIICLSLNEVQYIMIIHLMINHILEVAFNFTYAIINITFLHLIKNNIIKIIKTCTKFKLKFLLKTLHLH